ncbi:hypothetical protein [Geobacter sp. SVR]|uniref:hypothetical protein n=1 Tax=Geobacter sp. SVR TaxID=2495594 RepID=UPI00143F02EE|nr:hypothetical protein [Geobacter sp. SVR]BCS55871.1 hypothetical protein GSVR_41790 [Geobacter sp. SVR]GCF83875.1 hypothetical protein GSbR_04750 [Geobacter sp. SVR]
MKRILIALIFVSLAGSACAESIGFGVRGGGATSRSSYYAEGFADLYLNRLVSIGATAAYVMLDHNDAGSIRRDTSVPITALFKVRPPLPFFQPYAGLGAAVVFHENRGVKGTPVIVAGTDLNISTSPLFLNVEYRRQFDDKLDFLGGGLGIKF